MKILPTPEAVNPFTDPFSPSRPLVAICDSSGRVGNNDISEVEIYEYREVVELEYFLVIAESAPKKHIHTYLNYFSTLKKNCPIKNLSHCFKFVYISVCFNLHYLKIWNIQKNLILSIFTRGRACLYVGVLYIFGYRRTGELSFY